MGFHHQFVNIPMLSMDTSNRPYGSKYEATTGHICKKTTQKTRSIGSIGSIGYNMAFLYGIILGITWFNRQSYPAGRWLHTRPQDTHIQQFLLSLTGPQCDWLVEIAVSIFRCKAARPPPTTIDLTSSVHGKNQQSRENFPRDSQQ